MTEPPTGCGLYAVIEAGEGAGERLAAALAVPGLAAVLIAPGGGQALDADAARPLLDQAGQAGITALVLGDAELARALGADGVHLQALDNPQEAYSAARAAVGNDGIVGADAGISRHAAMVLAESGADYVAFGAPSHLKDRDKARARRQELVSWWAPVFEVPCVAFDVESPEEAEALAAAGADFVAVTLGAGLSSAKARALVEGVARVVASNPSSAQPS